MLWLVAGLVLAVATPWPGPQAMEQPRETSTRLGIITPSVVLEDSGFTFTGEAVFSLSGDTPVDITIDLIDIWTNDSGDREMLPLGSSPLSGRDRLRVGVHPARYEPSGEEQRIVIPVSITKASLESAPLLAGVRITVLETETTSTDGPLRVIGSALAFVYAATEGSLLSFDGFSPAVTVTNLRVVPIPSADNLTTLPSLTFVDRGPVALAFDSDNDGSMFSFLTHSATITRWGWGAGSEAPIFSHDVDEVTLIPGQARQDSIPVTARLAGSNREIDLLERWGIYEALLVSTSHTGSTSERVTETSILFVVFPVRVGLGLLIAITLLVITGLRLARNWAQASQLRFGGA